MRPAPPAEAGQQDAAVVEGLCLEGVPHQWRAEVVVGRSSGTRAGLWARQGAAGTMEYELLEQAAYVETTYLRRCEGCGAFQERSERLYAPVGASGVEWRHGAE